MEFSSLQFLLYFIPVFFLFYAVTPKAFKNVTLIVGSFVFYLQGSLYFFWVLPLSMLVNFWVGIGLESSEGSEEGRKKEILFVLAAVGNLAVLCHFKLWMKELPLGISFYTFSVISYLADVYQGETEAEKSPINFVTYLGMFPKLISGPITSYPALKDSLEERSVGAAKFQDGLKTFVFGLAYKTLLADRIGILWAEVEKTGYESVTWRFAWLGALSYAMMLYFNFYGYSLMAIGLGRMVGFELPENFNLPYLSRSVRDFYRRWHVTLGLWFRKYIYIPLGGSRKGEFRTILNLFAVWLFTGFWHGVTLNFFLWGLFLCLCIILERLISKIPFVKKLVITPHLWLWFTILISWVIFAIPDVRELEIYLRRMFGVGNPVNVNPSDWLLALKRHGIVLSIGVFCCFGLLEKAFQKWKDRIFMGIVLAVLFWLCVWKILAAGSNPFMYVIY